jgi:hypothetical protein
MNFEQWIVWLSLLGGLLFCLAAAFSPIRRFVLGDASGAFVSDIGV